MAERSIDIEFVVNRSNVSQDNLEGFLKGLFEPARVLVQLYIYDEVEKDENRKWKKLEEYIAGRLRVLKIASQSNINASQSSTSTEQPNRGIEDLDWYGLLEISPDLSYPPNFFISSIEYSYELLWGGIETLEFTIQLPYLTVVPEVLSKIKGNFPFPKLFDEVKLEYGYIKVDEKGEEKIEKNIITKRFIISRLPDFSYESDLKKISLKYTAISVPFIMYSLYSKDKEGEVFWSKVFPTLWGKNASGTKERSISINVALGEYYDYLFEKVISGLEGTALKERIEKQIQAFRLIKKFRFVVPSSFADRLANFEKDFRSIRVVKRQGAVQNAKQPGYTIKVRLGEEKQKELDVTAIFFPIPSFNRSEDIVDYFGQTLENLINRFFGDKFFCKVLGFSLETEKETSNQESLVLVINLLIKDLNSLDLVQSIEPSLRFMFTPEIDFGKLYELKDLPIASGSSEKINRDLKVIALPIRSFSVSDFLRSSWAIFHMPLDVKQITENVAKGDQQKTEKQKEQQKTEKKGEKQEGPILVPSSIGVPLKEIEVGTIFNPYIKPLDYIYIDPRYVMFYGGFAIVGGVRHTLLGSLGTTIKALWIYTGTDRKSLLEEEKKSSGPSF